MESTKCDLCETNDIGWKCITCDDLICEICKRSHLKSKFSSNHTVTEIKGIRHKTRVENKDSKCQIHQDEDLQIFCKDCNSFVCHDCIIEGSHQSHEFSKIEEILKSKREELSSLTSELRQSLAEYNKIAESVKENQNVYKTEIENLVMAIEKQKQKIISEVENYTYTVVAKIQSQEKIDQDSMKERKDALRSTIVEVESLIKSCEKNWKENIGNQKLLDFVSKVNSMVKKYQKYPNHIQTCPPKFMPTENTSDLRDLKDMFGYLDLETEQEKGSDYVVEEPTEYISVKSEEMEEETKERRAVNQYGNTPFLFPYGNTQNAWNVAPFPRENIPNQWTTAPFSYGNTPKAWSKSPFS